MSEDDSAGSFIAARAKLSESIERNVERGGGVAAQLDKTLISLSAGALVFSMTFVGAFAPGKLVLPLLFFAWGAFAACIICIIFAMRAEQTGIRKATQDIDALLRQLALRPLAEAANGRGFAFIRSDVPGIVCDAPTLGNSLTLSDVLSDLNGD